MNAASIVVLASAHARTARFIWTSNSSTILSYASAAENVFMPAQATRVNSRVAG
jgi:hypothetical protein